MWSLFRSGGGKCRKMPGVPLLRSSEVRRVGSASEPVEADQLNREITEARDEVHLYKTLQSQMKAKARDYKRAEVGAVQEVDTLQALLNIQSKHGLGSLEDQMIVQSITRGFQMRGHIVADYDPVYNIGQELNMTPLKPGYVITRANKVPSNIDQTSVLSKITYIGRGTQLMKLRKVLELLHSSYCGKVGVEFMLEPQQTVKNFLRQRLEIPSNKYVTEPGQRGITKDLLRAQAYDKLLVREFPMEKVHSMEGCELGNVIINLIVSYGSSLSYDVFLIGMGEFSRGATMIGVLGKSPEDVLGFWKDREGTSQYFMGASHKVLKSGRDTIISLCGHSGYPELYYPYLMGKAKSIQILLNDNEGERIMPIVMHSAAGMAFCPLTYEMIKLSSDPDYSVNGTIHICINNLVGYNRLMRSELGQDQCTDIAKAAHVPVFRCNSEDMEGIVFAAKTAVEYKKQFNRDVVIEICGYNNVHDYSSQPGLIRNLMKKMKDRRSFMDKLQEKLEKDEMIPKKTWEAWAQNYTKMFEKAYQKAKKKAGDKGKWNETLDNWYSIQMARVNTVAYPLTGVKKHILWEVYKASTTVPAGIDLPTNQRIALSARALKCRLGIIDWAIAEVFAIGTLMKDGISVRLSGPHVLRRCYLVSSVKDSNRTVNLLEQPFPLARLTVQHTNLHSTQHAAVTYELGFGSIDKPLLVIFEFPRGSRTNLSMAAFAGYLSRTEEEWAHKFNTVFLIPHCIQCAHSDLISNGRPEQIMLLCNEDELDKDKVLKETLWEANMIVASVSTPANLFHMLRRQVKLPHRRPLVIFVPDCVSVPREESVSTYADIAQNTTALLYMRDVNFEDGSEVARIVFCTGHIYYKLKLERDRRKLDKVIAIVRIEQMHPFPFLEIRVDVNKFASKPELLWVQLEAPQQGFANYVLKRLELLFPDRTIKTSMDSDVTGLQDPKNIFRLREAHIIYQALNLRSNREV